MLKLSILSALLWATQSTLAANATGACDETCQKAADLGAAYEVSQHADPNLAFYKTPSNFSRNLAPGTVLSVEYATNLSNFQVPSSLTMSRIIYTTTNLNGTVIPASAYIVWPYNKPAASGFPLVAWAHGTSGTFAACAPSNYRALQYHFMIPFALAMQGMPVVAPDYAGLGVGSLPDGTPVRHEYAASPAQANDVANAVIAARAAFPAYLSTSGSFVAAGHSQGGGVAWAFAERQFVQPVPGYKGTLVFAPAIRPVQWIEKAFADLQSNMSTASSAFTLFTQDKVIAGITAVYPQYNYSGLTDASYDFWHNGLARVQGCLPTNSLLQRLLPVAQFARPGWTRDPTVQAFVNRTAGGGKRFAGPMLVIAGEGDLPLAISNIEAVVNETCQVISRANGNEELEFITIGQMNHFPLIQASQSIWMDWIKDRLSSGRNHKRNSGPGCKKSVVEGFRTQFTLQGPTAVAPNWLVAGVPPEEVWKYTL